MDSMCNITSNINLAEAVLKPWEGRAIIHLDLDAFFAAVHQLDDPSLRGKPVIVGGSPEGRGVVSTASYEARKFGVGSAMPSKRAAELCPDAIWVRPDFARYSEVARDVMAIVESYTPLVERTSIDEAYADISPSKFIDLHPVEIAKTIIEQVSALGVTCSIGLSTSKTIAKIGSDFIKPCGLTVVRAGEERAFTKKMPTKKLTGAGPSTVKKLSVVGVRTLGDLAEMRKEDARQLLGSMGPTLVDRAGGIDPSDITTDSDTKSVSNEHTFPVNLTNSEEILSHLYAMSEKVGWRMRKAGLCGRTVTVRIRYADFDTHTMSKTLASATDDEKVFFPVAKALLEESGSLERSVRLIGIGLSNFSEAQVQMSFDDIATENGSSKEDERHKRDELVKKVDEIRARFGYGAIGSGAQLPRHNGDEI